MATEKWKSENQDKIRSYRREWYKKNAEHAKSKVVSRKAKIKEWLLSFKENLKCENCGENHISCLQFHHIDPSKKEQNISVAINIGWSIDRIQKEISKCKILCANCHFKHHWNEKNNL